MEIMIATETVTLSGFSFKPGFAALVEGDAILAATSGWECNSKMFVYRPQPDGRWGGRLGK